MNTRDRTAYRGLLVITAILPALGAVCAILETWSAAAVFGGLWMIAIPGVLHAQTRVINAGARSLRDTMSGRHGTVRDDEPLLDRLTRMSDDLAVMRARADLEPSQDDVQADLVRLAQSLRREVRFLQYSVSVSNEATDPQPCTPVTT